MTSKRSSLFAVPSSAQHAQEPEPVIAPEPVAPAPERPKHIKAATRVGKRVATVYLEPEALKALQKLCIDEETTIQALLVEGVNGVFAARGLSRIA
jgi:hypothetical protein